MRDLASEPLSPLELAEVDTVVFDPPRAGAKAQCEMLAKSKITRVVAVSCNPATLARDCRILVDAGFTLGPVHGVDQFLWSPHVEASEPLQVMVRHFAECVRDGKRPLSDGEAGLRVVRILEAAQRSIKAQGGRITL